MARFHSSDIRYHNPGADYQVKLDAWNLMSKIMPWLELPEQAELKAQAITQAKIMDRQINRTTRVDDYTEMFAQQEARDTFKSNLLKAFDPEIFSTQSVIAINGAYKMVERKLMGGKVEYPKSPYDTFFKTYRPFRSLSESWPWSDLTKLLDLPDMTRKDKPAEGDK